MSAVETFETLEEAARAMRSDAAYLGGGTILMRAVNEGVAPERLLRATEAGLSAIRSSGDRVTIGAAATMTDILGNRDLQFLHPAARLIGGPQIRNMATVGGNLFAEHPYGDLTVAFLALGASIVVTGQSGPQAIDDFLRDRNRAGLVSAIEVPRPRDKKSFDFLKVSRVKPKGVSVLSIAACLPSEGGVIRGARIAFGAMGPTALRASGAERALEGNRLDASTIELAAAAATERFDPPTDPLATSWYRKEVAGVHLRRLLQRMEAA